MNRPDSQSIRQSPKVILLSMPWATTTRPSLALGILAQICRREGIPAEVFYPNMDMSAAIGFEIAGHLANERTLYGFSEHLFAVDLFGPEVLSSNDYLSVLTGLNIPAPFRDLQFIRHLRDDVIPSFLDRLEERVLAAQPTVVGFTATFNQVLGSLALARRLKRRRPALQIIAGGACFDGEMGMEYHRAMPEILDHVFLGEADQSFPEYLKRHAADRSVYGIPGVTCREEGKIVAVPGERLRNMNEAQIPDFDDFFLEKDRLERETGKVFNIEFIPFESSRGCWWGQKNHCLFCGVNEELISFREKDVERVIREMVYLSSRYRVVHLTASDYNISRKSRRKIFQALKDLDLDIECFYETRADLTKEEIGLMKDAGIRKIQPGIESFSTEILHLMGKKTSRIRHVQFLRWCREYEIHTSYNVLAGFPGEEISWYFDMADFLPKIFHLSPPLHNMHYVEMHRFSPLFQRRHEFGVNTCQIREDYGFNFPEGMVDPLKIGYFFNFKASTVLDREKYAEKVRSVISDWIEAHKQKFPPLYHYILGPGFVRITDTRRGEGRYLHLSDLHQDVLLLCDAIQTLPKLRSLLTPLYPEEVSTGRLDEVVQEMIAEDILMQEGEEILTLPIGYRPRTTEALAAYVLGDTAGNTPASSAEPSSLCS